jgi:hypothetical protein
VRVHERRRQEKIYGRLALEVSALEKEIVLLRSELDRIGTNFEKVGESLKGGLSVVLDRELMEADVDALWDLVDRYNRAVEDAGSKKAELARVQSAL